MSWPPARLPAPFRPPLKGTPPEAWARHAHMTLYRGALWVPTVGVGALGEALGRSASMLRRLESTGVLMETPLRDPVRRQSQRLPQEGRRRYAVEMVRRAAAVARECGLLDTQPRNWADTPFRDELARAWAEVVADLDARATTVTARSATERAI